MIAQLEQTIADQRQELEWFRETPERSAEAVGSVVQQHTDPNCEQEEAQTPAAKPREASNTMDNAPGQATDAEVGEQRTLQPHAQGAVVFGCCYVVIASR